MRHYPLFAASLAVYLLSCAAIPASAQATANLVVDASVNLGTLSRPEQFDNFAESTTQPDLDILAQSPIDTIRLFGPLPGLYNFATGQVVTDSTDFAKANSIASNILVDIFDFKDIPSGTTDAQIDQAFHDVLTYYKTAYPKFKYVEVLNEAYSYEDPSQYYGIYKRWYKVLNQVNAELNPAVPLQIGGPCTIYKFWHLFLDTYAADTDPTKRLDFMTDHIYLGGQGGPLDGNGTINTTNEDGYSDPAFKGMRAGFDAELSRRGLTPGIPIFITESGGYPTLNTYNSSANRLASTAANATLAYYAQAESNTNLFRFSVRKYADESVEPFFDQFSSPGTPTTQYNLMKMEQMMKTNWVQSSSDSIDSHGFGVYSLAAADSSGVSVLAWNFQSDKATLDSYNTILNVNNIPSNLVGTNVTVSVYLVDSTHSNDLYDSTKPGLALLNRYGTIAGTSIGYGLNLEPNAIALLTITPATN